MDSLRDLWNDLDSAVVTGIAAVLILVGAVIVRRVVVRLLRRAYARRLDRASTVEDVEQLARMKRQRTLVTTVESLVRYGIYGAAVVIVLGLVTGGKSSAFFGASVVAVLVGFGLQRLLGDVVAGVLLLFEGHFAVGDVITVHQHNVTGVVEEFSLRTTALRTLGGDRIVVMNGAMLSVTRWSYGQREFRAELLVRGVEAAALVEAACDAEGEPGDSGLWIRPPMVIERAGIDVDLERLRLRLVVAPGHEALAERFGEVLHARLDESLVGPVTIVPVYGPTFEGWRAGLLLRD